ncbi:MAG: nickel pincer cofactor biosynthesis protein LarB [Lachnospiraceae bacterium]|nr:nickel pincer cofactor biosynthesis protein LarB [Lachnospiraceae bacterium]
MDTREILEQLQNGDISIEEAERYLRRQPYEDMGFAHLDMHRKVRTGYAEVVFCQGKPDEYLVEIFKKIYEAEGEVLGTRGSEQQFELLKKELPDVEYDQVSRILKIESKDKNRKGSISICTGGTADIPVAEEAAQTAEFFGCNVKRFYDIGVCGIHRVLHNIEDINDSNCIIAAAGMEGALVSVLGGLVDKPIIAVPTSVGYGVSDGGKAALYAMLSSCANGISVVNIDNGYGAAYVATEINRLVEG